MSTKFSTVYDRFLGKITDDMYMELTPQDTVKDLQKLLIDAIPGFEFPRQNLYDYEIKVETIDEPDVQPGDFIIGVVWAELPEEPNPPPQVIIEKSEFACDLTAEEINKIMGQSKLKGYTIVPLRVYFKDSLVKVEIGLARGKKLYDKRQDIAKKDQRREAEKQFKVKNLY